jgi:hypothetical protein
LANDIIELSLSKYTSDAYWNVFEECDSRTGKNSISKITLRFRARLVPQVNEVSLDSARQSPLSSIPAHLCVVLRLVGDPQAERGLGSSPGLAQAGADTLLRDSRDG